MTNDTFFAKASLDFPYGVVTKAHLIRWAEALPDTAAVGPDVDWTNERFDGLVATWDLP